MKAIVGFAFFLLFLAGFAFVMMQGKNMAQSSVAGGGASLTGIDWRPASVHDEPIPEDSGMYVTFEVDGSIRGNGGCNGFFGSLEQTDDGLSVGPLGSTRMACPEPIMDREMAFMDAVQSTKSFASGDFGMRLLDEEGKVLAEFVETGQD